MKPILDKKYIKNALKKAKKILLSGELVIFPTETVYGIGANATNLNAIQKIYDNLDSLVYTLKESSQHQSQIFSYMQSLTEQMKDMNSNSREQDKKLSNFLSTQLNTQSSMLQLTNQLSQEGLIDKQTKKYFENIDKGIQQLLLQSKQK